MKRFRVLMAVFSIALLGTMLAPSLQADAWNRKTVMTFSSPVEIPGVHLSGWGVLPAGTYVFKVMDSMSDRHIVQIFNKNETKIYATILAIPNYRLKATDKTAITFHERPAGEAHALRAWFYPGRTWGEEFVYPKAKAMQLAKASAAPVLFTPNEVPAEVTETIQPADVPVETPVIAELKQTPILAATPSGTEAPIAQFVTPPPTEVQVAEAPMASRLPATASLVPLAGALGLLMLGGVYLVRSVEKHIR